MAVDTIELDGVQVRKETGSGTIIEIDRRDRNIGFKIQSDNRAVQDPVTGWLDTFGLGEGAHPQFAKGQHVRYEIHVRRKDGVDPATPIAQLKPREKVRDLVLIQPLDEAPPVPPDAPPPSGAVEEPAHDVAAHLVDVGALAVARAAALASDVPQGDRLTKAADVLAAIAAELRDGAR